MKGIYTIISPTGRMYVGQSWDVEKRWKSYKYLSCKGQPIIYASLIKYGVDAHKFDYMAGIPEIHTQCQMDYWEQYLISTFRVLGVKMLNAREAGSNGKMHESSKLKISISNKGKRKGKICGELNPYFGKKHTDEIRAKMSKSNKGKKIGDKNGRARAISQYDKSGILINEFTNITGAAISVNIKRTSISAALNNYAKTAGGFIWKYKQEKTA